MKLAIFGAKSIALGVCLALRRLYPEHKVETFLVSSLKGNPSVLAGIPVQEVQSFRNKGMHVLVATPEDMHSDIIDFLEMQGFYHYICIDSHKESILMEKYFEKSNIFPSVHKLTVGNEKAKLQIYQAKFYKDKRLNNSYILPDWIVPIQAGTALTSIQVAEVTDCVGDNISKKNETYCELTVLYWLWKNRLLERCAAKNERISESSSAEYYGLFHYRRLLDIQNDDLYRMKKNGVDVILPYPLPHEPNIYEHHTRYVSEQEWKILIEVLEDLEPEYARAFPKILQQPYLYNYNMIIAKRDILRGYCEWLFPILKRTEELSTPKGWERADRYIGYLGENLLTLYFMFHADEWKIKHVGRKMLI